MDVHVAQLHSTAATAAAAGPDAAGFFNALSSASIDETSSKIVLEPANFLATASICLAITACNDDLGNRIRNGIDETAGYIPDLFSLLLLLSLHLQLLSPPQQPLSLSLLLQLFSQLPLRSEE
jgi:hypothetical protein